jgi:hypothetical protein
VLLVQEFVLLWKTSTLAYHNSAGFELADNTDDEEESEEEDDEVVEQARKAAAWARGAGPFFFI